MLNQTRQELEALRDELQQAENEHFLQNKLVESLPEFKALYKAKRKVQHLKNKVKKVEEKFDLEKVEEYKQKLINNGFECRTGHKVSSAADDDFISYDGAPFTFVILPRQHSSIQHIHEYSWGADIVTEDGKKTRLYHDDCLVLGHGETESEAWDKAVDNWIS